MICTIKQGDHTLKSKYLRRNVIQINLYCKMLKARVNTEPVLFSLKLTVCMHVAVILSLFTHLFLCIGFDIHVL